MSSFPGDGLRMRSRPATETGSPGLATARSLAGSVATSAGADRGCADSALLLLLSG